LPNPTGESWHDLFDRHAAALILFARQWCRSHADAEDAVQEAFVRFWRSRKQADDAAAYLFTCVKHAALDQSRGEVRRKRREERTAQDRDDLSPLFKVNIEERERAAAIELHLGSLPAEQREVVVMKVWGGLTFAQIAAALDASANTVASRYRYGIEALRRSLPRELVT